MPPENSEQSNWFAEQVQPHEPMLRAWLRAQFPREGDVDDIVQEAFVRVLQAQATTAIASPKAFLFATARNVALGRLRHAKVADNFLLAETGLTSICDDNVNVADEVARAQELELLTQAIQSLPNRCRQIITLRRIYGMSQKEVAAELGIAEHTVEVQGTIGLRKLTEYLERFQHRSSLRRG